MNMDTAITTGCVALMILTLIFIVAAVLVGRGKDE